MIYLTTIVLSGLVYWFTRKTEMRTRGHLVFAAFMMLVPVVNLILAIILAWRAIAKSGWFNKELSWYTPKKSSRSGGYLGF